MALGMKLKQAREAMGLTESDIAERTHIMVQMVSEIEAEDFHRFSAPIYGKGFIKLFAKTVGLDPAPLVAEFMAAATGGAEKPAKPPHVALEAIDKHNETGISIVSPEVPEQPEERAAPTAPTPPVPRHVYAKASAVTMPNADSPHPLPSPARPPARPAPAPEAAAQPAAPKAPAPAAPSAEPAPAPAGEGFRLEAEPAVSVAPPQPVAQPARPFKYPVPKQPARQAPAPVPAPARAEEEEEEDDEPIVARPPRPRPARRNRARTAPALGEALLRWLDGVRAQISELRHRSDEDDEHEPLGDVPPVHRRRWIVGVVAAVLLVAVLLAIPRGGDPEGTAPDLAQPVEAVVDPVADGGEEPVAETPRPDALAETPAARTPAEIVRVLPPPKCFAR